MTFLKMCLAGLQVVLLLQVLVHPASVSAAKCTKPSIRKEWRALSRSERAEWIRAVNVSIFLCSSFFLTISSAWPHCPTAMHLLLYIQMSLAQSTPLVLTTMVHLVLIWGRKLTVCFDRPCLHAYGCRQIGTVVSYPSFFLCRLWLTWKDISQWVFIPLASLVCTLVRKCTQDQVWVPRKQSILGLVKGWVT